MPDRDPMPFKAMTVLAACAVVLNACAKPAPPKAPAATSIAKADPSIVAVQPTEKGIRVVARIATPDLAGDTITASARAIRQIARAVQNKATDLPEGAMTLTFDLYGVDVDKFGKRTPGRIFESDFDVDDMKSLDLKSKGPAAVLNTAIDLRIDKGGVDPINAWCMRYPHVGANYCNMAGD